MFEILRHYRHRLAHRLGLIDIRTEVYPATHGTPTEAGTFDVTLYSGYGITGAIGLPSGLQHGLFWRRVCETCGEVIP